MEYEKQYLIWETTIVNKTDFYNERCFCSTKWSSPLSAQNPVFPLFPKWINKIAKRRRHPAGPIKSNLRAWNLIGGRKLHRFAKEQQWRTRLRHSWWSHLYSCFALCVPLNRFNLFFLFSPSEMLQETSSFCEIISIVKHCVYVDQTANTRVLCILRKYFPCMNMYDIKRKKSDGYTQIYSRNI